MPCMSIIRNTVEFKAGTDLDLMKTALEAEGYLFAVTSYGIQFSHKDSYRMGGTFNDGVFRVNQGTDTDAIKRAYSKAAVNKAAQKFGWKIQLNSKDKNKLKITRGY